jgi:hypothetical protein
MKRIILLLVISVSLLTFPSCQSNEKDKDNDKNKSELNSADVPEAVKSAFSVKYSTATDVRWETAHENDKKTYKAKFMLNDKKMKAEFDTTGGFIKGSENN